MNNLVLVIIDDEPKAREVLKGYICMLFPNNRFEMILCNSVKEGVLAIENYLPDLVFLDIEMPEANGFELFNKVNKDSFEVVFVTAYSQFLDKSVNEIGCFGYLQKPLEREKLLKIFERYQAKNTNKKYLKLVNASQGKRILIKLEDVTFCRADDNYCEIFLKNDKTKHILSRTLGDLEKKLPQQLFQRVHRSYMVNMDHVSYFEKDKNLLVINQNGMATQKIPVSAKYKEAIRKMFL
ncbi:LytTR family DNA-binding domain-containing protein [Flavobacterium sp. CBA20B-1]|uniref:LytR/AlgR family response regulator transcription factor n=1 Tax=unclassified Flavobacterium TaxID=196869 RepID=UPI0022255F5B|nr:MULTISPECIES: LytTR family DNA-binding domain-containing protein [unclassified Flavobacterium]WCM42108.1 LytTR family DNA-binding domain-containing protein [Flavobacterium sp. CBA20B-1]